MKSQNALAAARRELSSSKMRTTTLATVSISFEILLRDWTSLRHNLIVTVFWDPQFWGCSCAPIAVKRVIAQSERSNPAVSSASVDFDRFSLNGSEFLQDRHCYCQSLGEFLTCIIITANSRSSSGVL
jgi:hypothetical protein